MVHGVQVERATVRRVCSALPGGDGYGMGAPRARPYEAAAGNGAPLQPGAGRSPAGGIVLTVARAVRTASPATPVRSAFGVNRSRSALGRRTDLPSD